MKEDIIKGKDKRRPARVSKKDLEKQKKFGVECLGFRGLQALRQSKTNATNIKPKEGFQR